MKIKGFPNYQIFEDGSVLNTSTGKLKTKRLVRGYHYVDLHNKEKRLNLRLGRLVAMHFISNPKNLPQINHIDGNCLNDCASNLEWVTVSENQLHKNKLARIKGTYIPPKGKMVHSKKKINKIFILRNKGLLHRQIAEKLNMGISTVTHVLLGTRRSNQKLNGTS